MIKRILTLLKGNKPAPFDQEEHDHYRSYQVKPEIMTHFDAALADFVPTIQAKGPYQLRWGTYEDIPQFIRLQQRGYDGFLAWSQQDFIKDFRKNPYRFYLVVTTPGKRQTEQVIALISGRLLARGSHISHLIVDPDYQQLGLGRDLAQCWLAFVQRAGVPHCELEVAEANQRAIRMYKGLGFHQRRVLRHYYARDQHAWQMRWQER